MPLFLIVVFCLFSGGHVWAQTGSCDGTDNCNSYSIGSDPGVSSPTTENTPGATSILSPLLNLLPSLSSFAVPSHTGTCPVITFDVFNKTLVMNSHCTIAEEIRSSLSVIMLAFWPVTSLIVVMRA